MRKIATPLLASVTLLLTILFSQNSFAQSTVVLAGNFQTKVGCPVDWAPDCDATRLSKTSEGIWEGIIFLPAGSWEYKVTYNNSWSENYGDPGGGNLKINLYAPQFVHFTYYSDWRYVTYKFVRYTVVLAGSFQSELGCRPTYEYPAGDWNPACNTTGLTYDPIARLWYGFFAIPPGDYTYKVTINNSWNENYGKDGVLGGADIPLSVKGENKTLFRYDPVSHLVTTAVVHSVTLVGSFQDEIGCSGDWMPYCGNTVLSINPATNTYRREIVLPPGDWEFKAAVDGKVLDGANIPLKLSEVSRVSFLYNPETRAVTYTVKPTTVVIAGTFQSELGCQPVNAQLGGDWEPACDATRLTYDALKRVWTRTFDLPAGYWEFKAVHDNSWNESYGRNGSPEAFNNIPLYLMVPVNITFNYDPVTHLVELVYNTTGFCTTAFYDANANGYMDWNENTGMEGVALDLSGKTNAVQYSGSDGKTCFTNLPPGEYTVKAVLPDGYLPTAPETRNVNLTRPDSAYFGMVCLGGADAKSTGFWIGKQGKAVFDGLEQWQKYTLLSSLNYLNLRNADGTDFNPWSYDQPLSYERLRIWLQQANAKNMAYKLSAELATLKLNVATGIIGGDRMVYAPGIKYGWNNNGFISVNDLIDYTNNLLAVNGKSFGGDAGRYQMESLKNLLEEINGDSRFVQLQPCGAGMVTSAHKGVVGEIANIAPASVVWPNPSGACFNLRPGGMAGEVQVRVMDVNGRLVHAATGSAQKEYRFGEGFKAGLYFVEITQGGNRSTIKVIKQ